MLFRRNLPVVHNPTGSYAEDIALMDSNMPQRQKDDYW